METIHLTKQCNPFTFSKKQIFYIATFMLLSVILLTSCEKDYWGRDGNPGRAYLALTWYDNEPDYLDIGNTEIPHQFYWDEFYRVTPGFYNMYYEITYESWGFVKSRAFEMDYEIWEESGEAGRLNYNGQDGRDAYFTLELDKKGPSIYHELSYKSEDTQEPEIGNAEINKNFTITQKKNGLGIKITWREVELKSN